MLELGIKFAELGVEDLDMTNEYPITPKKGSGYKGFAKVLWNQLRKNPYNFFWIYTKVYAKKNGRWIYFMTFDDKVYPDKGYCGRRAFSTRKGIQKYLRYLRGCIKTALKEEVPERLDITDKFSVVYLD